MPKRGGRGGSGEPRRVRNPLKSPRQMLEQEIGLAKAELARPTRSILGSGLLAGLAICVSVLLVAVVSGSGTEVPELLQRFFVGNAYAAGFLVVIFARADLFTEYTTIAVLPALFGRSSVTPVARLWGLVYAGNIVGAVLGAGFLIWLATSHAAIEPGTFGTLAAELTRGPTTGLLLSAVLTGWLMGLLSWLIVAARETVSQVVFVWVTGVTIGMAYLPHSITGTAEVAAAALAGLGPDVGEVLQFMLLSTLGNAVGSVLFALLIRASAPDIENGDA